MHGVADYNDATIIVTILHILREVAVCQFIRFLQRDVAAELTWTYPRVLINQ
jgi:hypothetical protein